MAEIFSHTTWVVRPGQEAEFVRRWTEWADWTHRQGFAGHGRLLRDSEAPDTYISFGPWPDIRAVKNWRKLEGYHERVARLQEVVTSFEPRTFEVVADR